MRHCPKCELTFADSARICRSCGAILDEAADPTVEGELPVNDGLGQRSAWLVDESQDEAVRPELADAAGQLVEGRGANAGDWTCPECGEKVPTQFDICWNCQADRPRGGSVDGDRAAESSTVSAASSNVPPLRCPACHSEKIIVGAQVLDQGHPSTGLLNLVVYGSPNAILFKERLQGQLLADVCGDCGHVQLRVTNPAALYERYLKSRK